MGKETFEVDSKDFSIDNSSLFALENDLKRYSELVYDYGRAYARAIVEEQKAQLYVEMLVAKLVKEYSDSQKKEVSPYAMGEIRKSIAPLDIRYQDAKVGLIEATERVNVLKGAYYAIVYKNERLKECFSIAMRDLLGDGKLVIQRRQEKMDEQKNQEKLETIKIETGI